MKNIFCMMTILSLSLFANATQPKLSMAAKQTKATCERLTKQAEENCTESMCEMYLQDLGEEQEDYECVKDGDFWEGHGICVFDDELPSLIKAYNKKNPGKNLSCDNL